MPRKCLMGLKNARQGYDVDRGSSRKRTAACDWSATGCWPSGNRSEQPVPHPGFAPADEPVVAGPRWAVPLRYLGPRRAGAKAPENALQHPPVVNSRNAARLVRQQRSNDRPFQSVSSYRRRAIKPPSEMEGLNQLMAGSSSRPAITPAPRLTSVKSARRRGNHTHRSAPAVPKGHGRSFQSGALPKHILLIIDVPLTVRFGWTKAMLPYTSCFR